MTENRRFSISGALLGEFDRRLAELKGAALQEWTEKATWLIADAKATNYNEVDVVANLLEMLDEARRVARKMTDAAGPSWTPRLWWLLEDAE